MGLPLVTDDTHGVSALGPWPGSGRALVSAEAPELVLPDLDGERVPALVAARPEGPDPLLGPLLRVLP